MCKINLRLRFFKMFAIMDKNSRENQPLLHRGHTPFPPISMYKSIELNQALKIQHVLSIIKKYIEHILHWFKTNQMSANPEKIPGYFSWHKS